MYYVIQVYMFDAIFSVIFVDQYGNQTLRGDLINYQDLLTECHNLDINKIIFTGDNFDFIQGLTKEVQLLEYRLFNENKIEIEIIKNTEVIPE